MESGEVDGGGLGGLVVSGGQAAPLRVSVGKQAIATLKGWRLLRCSTTRITALVQAVLALHLRVVGWMGTYVGRSSSAGSSREGPAADACVGQGLPTSR